MEPKPTSSSLLPRAVNFILAAAVSCVLLSQCQTYSPLPPPPEASTSRSGYSAEAGRLQERPGLGTQLGHEIHDSSKNTHFYRKAAGQPDAMATLHYNDKEGARMMAEMSGKATKHRGSFALVPGLLDVEVVEGSWGGGSAFEHYRAGGKIFVMGDHGSSYSLRLKNLTEHRLEVVISIDGLDILDGRPASVRKSGYVVAAKSTVTISGMKTGGKLRSLKFGTVADSRAATAFGAAGARNVGVIGMAVYEEDEAARRRVHVEETYLREGARAFGN